MLKCVKTVFLIYLIFYFILLKLKEVTNIKRPNSSLSGRL